MGVWDQTNGQLGDGTTTDLMTPFKIVSSDVESIAAGGNHSLFVKTTNGSRSLWVMGSNGNGQLGDGTTTDLMTPFEIQDISSVSLDVKEVAAGGNHSLFVKTDGSLWVMGANTNGQLGDTTTNDLMTPFQIVSSRCKINCRRWESFLICKDGWESVGDGGEHERSIGGWDNN